MDGAPAASGSRGAPGLRKTNLRATAAVGHPARGLRVPVPLVPGLAGAPRPCPQAPRLPPGGFLTRPDQGPAEPYLLKGGERAAECPGHATRPGQHRGSGGDGGAEGGRTPDIGPGNNRKWGGPRHPPRGEGCSERTTGRWGKTTGSAEQPLPQPSVPRV